MENTNWKGYSFEELRYKRALTTIKCELEKDQLKAAIASLKQGGLPLIAGGNKGGLMSKILGALDVADYSLIAFKLVHRIYKLFRRKRKEI